MNEVGRNDPIEIEVNIDVPCACLGKMHCCELEAKEDIADIA